MTERTRSTRTVDLIQLIEEARRLRSEEIARLGGQLFQAPGRLLKQVRQHRLIHVRTS